LSIHRLVSWKLPKLAIIKNVGEWLLIFDLNYLIDFKSPIKFKLLKCRQNFKSRNFLTFIVNSNVYSVKSMLDFSRALTGKIKDRKFESCVRQVVHIFLVGWHQLSNNVVHTITYYARGLKFKPSVGQFWLKLQAVRHRLNNCT